MDYNEKETCPSCSREVLELDKVENGVGYYKCSNCRFNPSYDSAEKVPDEWRENNLETTKDL